MSCFSSHPKDFSTDVRPPAVNVGITFNSNQIPIKQREPDVRDILPAAVFYLKFQPNFKFSPS